MTIITWTSNNDSSWTAESNLPRYESIKKLSMEKKDTVYKLTFTIKTQPFVYARISPNEFIKLVELLTGETLTCTTSESSEETLITYSVNCTDHYLFKKFNNIFTILKKSAMLPDNLEAPSLIDKPVVPNVPNITLFETKVSQPTSVQSTNDWISWRVFKSSKSELILENTQTGNLELAYISKIIFLTLPQESVIGISLKSTDRKKLEKLLELLSEQLDTMIEVVFEADRKLSSDGKQPEHALHCVSLSEGNKGLEQMGTLWLTLRFLKIVPALNQSNYPEEWYNKIEKKLDWKGDREAANIATDNIIKHLAKFESNTKSPGSP